MSPMMIFIDSDVAPVPDDPPQGKDAFFVIADFNNPNTQIRTIHFDNDLNSVSVIDTPTTFTNQLSGTGVFGRRLHVLNGRWVITGTNTIGSGRELKAHKWDGSNWVAIPGATYNYGSVDSFDIQRLSDTTFAVFANDGLTAFSFDGTTIQKIGNTLPIGDIFPADLDLGEGHRVAYASMTNLIGVNNSLVLSVIQEDVQAPFDNRQDILRAYVFDGTNFGETSNIALPDIGTNQLSTQDADFVKLVGLNSLDIAASMAVQDDPTDSGGSFQTQFRQYRNQGGLSEQGNPFLNIDNTAPSAPIEFNSFLQAGNSFRKFDWDGENLTASSPTGGIAGIVDISLVGESMPAPE